MVKHNGQAIKHKNVGGFVHVFSKVNILKMLNILF